MSLIPGVGLLGGMAVTLRRFFEPKVTIKYPEVRADVAPKFRGRLQLLYDEWGTLKCETCFQCAQACPIECIDMGGIDTRGRYHVHWGAPETYGERREESAMRRSGRPVPDPAYRPFAQVDLGEVDRILEEVDHEPVKMLEILEATQAAYGYLPVAALTRISPATGAWYAFNSGTATFSAPRRFEPPTARDQAAAVARRPPINLPPPARPRSGRDAAPRCAAGRRAAGPNLEWTGRNRTESSPAGTYAPPG